MASSSAQSMVNDAAQHGGMLPKWSLADGEAHIMVGDPADGILGGYYAFGARNFDTAAALSAGRGDRANNIRPGLSYYDNLGYVPSDGTSTCCNFYGPVSTTLEYGAADFALAGFAAALGDTPAARMLVRRSQDWQNLYNPATGLIQPKTAAGTFVPVTLTTQDNYVEGDASQYRWEAGWNLHGLFTAMAGNAAVNKALDTFWTDFNDGPASPYSYWDNQFEYALPWAYNFTGAPWKTQQLVNRIRTQLYLDAPAALGDNDDLGATSSMGVMTMLGIFPEYISTAGVTLNSPEFRLEIIHLANRHTITLTAPQASASNIYVKSLKLNGRPWNRPWLPGPAFTAGATLDFTLGAAPDKGWAAAPQDAPPSYSYGEMPAIGYLSSQQVTVPPGGTITVQIGAQDVTGRPQAVQASAAPPSGITVTAGSRTIHVPPAGKGCLTLTVHAGSAIPQTFYTVPVKLTAGGTTLPGQTLTVVVAQPGSLPAAFNNAGIPG